MTPSASSITPFYFGVEDYRAIIVNFLMELITGDEFVLITKSSMRRLLSIQLQSIENYIKRSEELFDHHKITEKMESLFND